MTPYRVLVACYRRDTSSGKGSCREIVVALLKPVAGLRSQDFHPQAWSPWLSGPYFVSAVSASRMVDMSPATTQPQAVSAAMAGEPEEVTASVDSPQRRESLTKPSEASGEPAPYSGSDLEKPPFVFTTQTGDGEEEAIDDNDPRLKDIPPYVRRIVSLVDDPTLPTLTFRYFVLTFVFVVPGAFLSMMSHFRTTYAPYSVFFVQIASSYAGVWLEKVLPAWQVNVPFTKWGFNLNPGPFSVKEHVLITISAASGATYNLGYAPISMAELYFNSKVHPAVAIFFMWGIVWTGYSFAAIARQFLIYDPQFPWFTA